MDIQKKHALGVGYQTDLIFDKQNGIIEEKNDFYSIRTPDNPDYYFGNYLLLKYSPTNQNKERLSKLFEQEIGVPPRINHKTYCWSLGPDEKSDVTAFIDDGFSYMECSVLVGDRQSLITPARMNTEITVRNFQGEDDWEQLYQIQLAGRKEGDPIETYTAFLQESLAAYQRLIQQGIGDWYGAFIRDELVGSLGLFFGEGLGRFQEVVTKPEYRNRGICKTLVYETCKKGLQRTEQLVMAADEGYHAAKIYESLGFMAVERQASLCWRPKEPENEQKN